MKHATIDLQHDDCLEAMDYIPDNCIDMVLADPPYGTTACKWDSVINLDLMWAQLKRVIKPNGAIVMTASQPFTTVLISSNLRMFKHDWVWQKTRATGFLQAGHRPLKMHESVLIFVTKGKPTFNPQRTTGHPPTNSAKGDGHSPTFGKSKVRNYVGGDTTRHPVTIQAFHSERGLHPTQKPVPLMEYLIRTYTNPGDTVLDFAMGSGTTGIACLNTGRKFIGVEKDKKYFEIAKERIANHETRDH